MDMAISSAFEGAVVVEVVACATVVELIDGAIVVVIGPAVVVVVGPAIVVVVVGGTYTQCIFLPNFNSMVIIPIAVILGLPTM